MFSLKRNVYKYLLPNLLETQRISFCWFLELGFLQELENFSAIRDYLDELELNLSSKFYKIRQPKYTLSESKRRDTTYSVRIYTLAQLFYLNNPDNTTENEVLLCDIPLMTNEGTFLVNGVERIIINQIVRSPGIYYKTDSDKQNFRYYTASLISNRGTWVKFEMNKDDFIHVKIDKAKKISAYIFLKAVGLSDSDIFNKLEHPEYFQKTFKEYESISLEDAFLEVHNKLRPGEPATFKAGQQILYSRFFDPKRYDLGRVGRYKINKRLNLDIEKNIHILTTTDVLYIINELINFRIAPTAEDDIDHLGNRRIRSVGELLQNQIRIGLNRLERIVQERMIICEQKYLRVNVLVNPKPLVSSIREFFGSNPLSQFMDQTNPLAELTHKRRLSVLGPGGITRDRAGFAVRDIHPSQYGRICPVETPEGPNAGLIGSLSTYGRVNSYGFIETPFYKVEKGKVLQDSYPIYLDATVEDKYRLAAADLEIDDNGVIQNQSIPVRYRQDLVSVVSTDVDYIAISPIQVVSLATALIPFLEHDDANRALMGSNMQRQAVPTLIAEKPLVGTGMERAIARDSHAALIANRGGKVDSVDAGRIVVRVNDSETTSEEAGVDIYNLTKYTRSNQNTCINQRPLVKVGDVIAKNDVLADGPSTDLGELALGQNMLIAFMPWNGYNFEDSILISEKVAREDRFTSIHIQELTCIARDTKLGSEEITADIPNVGEGSLGKLDDCGIVYVGAEVEPGDILVGKITPKGETQLSPEEKLLRAIFGEKASDVKDTSLRAPSSTKGTVIGVEVFTRDGVEKDTRTQAIEEDHLAQSKKDADDETRIVEEATKLRVAETLKGNKVVKAAGMKKGTSITLDDLTELSLDELLAIRTDSDSVNTRIEETEKNLKQYLKDIKTRFEEKREKIIRGHDLAPGVIKIVKVYLAIKRRIQPGDKMAGRHGNKGVISEIMPIEDMPHDEFGVPVDIVLNPLGVPSRMNVGQILETHMGMAAKGIGEKIDAMLKENAKPVELKSYLDKLYNKNAANKEDIESFNNSEISELASNLTSGLPIATPVFDGAKESEVKDLLKLADLPESGQFTLYDGRTGTKFERPVTVGYMYIIKLNHLVDDKMHARSTGSYSLVTQQPLGGKAQFGGQRFGEMEVWALEAYGASYTLQEMLTVKSDDVAGRTKMYKNIVDGSYQMDANIPESFNVLSKEIKSLGINIELDSEN